jgi:hypothetical protein
MYRDRRIHNSDTGEYSSQYNFNPGARTLAQLEAFLLSCVTGHLLHPKRTMLGVVGDPVCITPELQKHL